MITSASFPGPKLLGSDALRLLKAGADAGAVLPAVEACLNCKRCELACPHGVRITRLISDVKERTVTAKKHYWRDLLLSYPGFLGKVGTIVPGLVNFFLSNKIGRKLAKKVMSLDADAVSNYASRPLSRVTSSLQAAETNRKVVYFAGCYANYIEPEIGKSLVELLGLLKIGVVVPTEHCCGMPLLANGFKIQAKKAFQKNLKALLPYLQEGCDILCTCPTCALALKQVYLEELGTDEAEVLSKFVYDASEYLVNYSDQLAGLIKPVKLHMVYHQPCHTLAQGVGQPSLTLLKLIPELKLQAVDGCCGQSGTYGFKQEKKKISEAVGKALFKEIEQCAPDLVSTDCGACTMRIKHDCHLDVKHPLSVLLQSIKTDDSLPD